MKRGELRPVTLSKGLPNPVCSGSKFSYGKEKPAQDSSASKTTFQILAENCGFKVIKEESKDQFACHPVKNHSEASITQAAENMPSRLQRDNNVVSREVIVVSRVNNVMGTENKEQKSSGAYLVTRNKGDVAPKVDFLDMAEVSDTLDNSLPNVGSKKYNISGEHNSVGETREQCTAKQECQGKSTNGHRRWPRYKIMKTEQWSQKLRGKDERNKTTAFRKIRSRCVDLSKSPHGSDRSTKNQPQIFKLSSRRTDPRILLCDRSSVFTKDSECVGEKDEPDNTRKEHNNDQACNTTTGVQVKGNNRVNNADRSVDSLQGGDQMFSNVNSSCLHSAAVQEVRPQHRKKNIVGGMLSYLRKMASTSNNECRDNLRGSIFKEVPASSRPDLNRQSNKRTAISKYNRFHHDRQMLLPAAKLKEKGPPYSQQKYMSPRKVRMTSGITKYDIRTCDIGGDNATTRFPQVFRISSEVPTCASAEKGIEATFRLDRNGPQDYNINFNDEDVSDDEVSFNSFIGYYLFKLWQSQCMCDVRIKVGNTSFLAHRIVLAAFTDVFSPDDPHETPTISVEVPDVTEEAVKLILNYLYTSEMEVTDSVLESVYKAASVLEIEEVTELISELLSKPTVQNFEKYLKIRRNIGLPVSIMDVYSEFVLENILEIQDLPCILGMQLADMVKLLQDPNVQIDCETDMFRLIIKWLKYNPSQRTKHAAELLGMVDYDCIGPETLSSIVEQNRHLFDLASMDIIMGAFRKFALRCKDAAVKDIHGEVHNKSGRSKCLCKDVPSTSKDHTGNYTDEEIWEGPWYPEPSPVNERFIPEVEAKPRKIYAMSPQDIRKSARHYCTGQIQMASGAQKACSQNEATNRSSKTGKYNCRNSRPEVPYTIRQKRLGDSSNNFPSEYCDLRLRSSSSESRRGQFYRGLNSSRSDTDTGQAPPVCDCCCLQEGHLGRRTVYACGGNNSHDPDRLSSRCEPECRSNNVIGPRQCRDARNTTRRLSCNHVCQRSRSSSQSSASSLRYNGSSSGSSKKVTFS